MRSLGTVAAFLSGIDMPKVTRTQESERIGEQLRALRQATTVSLNQAAEFMDQARQSFVLYETGQPVSIDRFIRILALFEITPAEFFASPEMRELLTDVRIEAALYREQLRDNTKFRSRKLKKKVAVAGGFVGAHVAG
jgi:transcriptional regulator with XRE-family HTH domain